MTINYPIPTAILIFLYAFIFWRGFRLFLWDWIDYLIVAPIKHVLLFVKWVAENIWERTPIKLQKVIKFVLWPLRAVGIVLCAVGIVVVSPFVKGRL